MVNHIGSQFAFLLGNIPSDMSVRADSSARFRVRSRGCSSCLAAHVVPYPAILTDYACRHIHLEPGIACTPVLSMVLDKRLPDRDPHDSSSARTSPSTRFTQAATSGRLSCFQICLTSSGLSRFWAYHPNTTASAWLGALPANHSAPWICWYWSRPSMTARRVRALVMCVETCSALFNESRKAGTLLASPPNRPLMKLCWEGSSSFGKICRQRQHIAIDGQGGEQ